MLDVHPELVIVEGVTSEPVTDSLLQHKSFTLLAVAPAAGYIGYCRVYGSASEFSASTISDNFDVIKNRYGLS